MYDPKELNDHDLDALESFQEELGLLLTTSYFILKPIDLIKNKKAGIDVFVNVKLASLPTLVPYGTKNLPQAIDDVYVWEMFWYKVKVFLQVGLQLTAVIILLTMILK